MGFWDALKSLFDALNRLLAPSKRGRTQRHRSSHAPRATPRPDPAEDAWRRRRARPPSGSAGKPLSPYRLRNYERIERVIGQQVGRFPWTSEEAHRTLTAKGFSAPDVEKYLKSPAAKRLLE